MNDRFKFRVWSIANRKYCHFATMDLSADDLLRVIRPLEQSEYIDDYENRYIIQQCTGLKDKNGTLIYEGDIVKDWNNKIYKIVWLDDAACFLVENIETNSKMGIYALICDENNLEVIGNIYENKELLQ